MRNFTKKVVATTTAVLMSASVLAGTALAAGTGTANTAYQSLVDTVTSTKQVRNAFNAKSVARNAAKGTQKAGSTSSLTANQIVTNVIKIKGAGAAAANGTTVSDKVAASKAAAAAANAAYTNAASAIGEPDLTQTAGAMFGPYVPEGAYTNQIAPVIDYTMINVPGPDGQISDGNAQDW